ncbi:glycosyltransferase family 4 protein [Mesorhizobium sp. B2-1-3]|uniref:glycosyltransferase n=1 Tax=Mesorhizobium sp. B2-1-3 TaxID=2589972 RepID=UPI00112E4D91|nr:glycosyltransferase [Mesorhizobium sp. B2-1-3]TPN16257.1 glycosyltransferase family 4 protein [Mesorhizobium sp. B2-1-3]
MNHGTLRKFEVPLLESLGYEVFLPKVFPYDEGNLSASIDYSRDAGLSIPPDDLEILNQHDFYSGLSPEIAEIANRHFDIAFFGFFPAQLAGLIRQFKNVCVMRPFGLSKGVTYTDVTVASLKYFFLDELQKNKSRFWFGQAYDHLAEIETGVYLEKAVTLPLGLDDARVTDEWTGENAKILFVCPRIGSSPYFNYIYRNFLRAFGEYPHVIGGAQPIDIPDPNVTGMLPRDDYDRLMRQTRVMFYHSQEMRHLHYHPLEAVRLGMPLVFMAGGMLDLLGGANLPGRCKTEAEAKKKLKAVLAGDKKLIAAIKSTQGILLNSMSRDFCEAGWRKEFPKIEASVEHCRSQALIETRKRKKVAVILPAPYRGGTLNMVKLLAKMLKRGSIEHGATVEVVFGYPDDAIYTETDWRDLHAEGIETRPFKIAEIDGVDLSEIQACLGYESKPQSGKFTLHKDGTYDFLDCDFWLLGSDRYVQPVAPLRPYCVFAHDYLQRYYAPLMGDNYEGGFIETARNGVAVLANTPHTIEDVVHYVGKPRSQAILVPHVAELDQLEADVKVKKGSYFIWTTNLGPHKNHLKTLMALSQYYSSHDGTLDCHITGVGTDKLDPNVKIDDGNLPDHVKDARAFIRKHPHLADRLTILGDISSSEYAAQMKGAKFLLHNVIMDNGTLCAVEAAYVGTPTLSSDYPPMRYISERYSLNAEFFDPSDPAFLAKRLKEMEKTWVSKQATLPSVQHLEGFGWRGVSYDFFGSIKGILGR